MKFSKVFIIGLCVICADSVPVLQMPQANQGVVTKRYKPTFSFTKLVEKFVKEPISRTRFVNKFNIDNTKKIIDSKHREIQERMQSIRKRQEKVQKLQKRLEIAQQKNKKREIESLEHKIEHKNGKINLDERWIEQRKKELGYAINNLDHYEGIAVKEGFLKEKSGMIKEHRDKQALADKLAAEERQRQMEEYRFKHQYAVPKFEDLDGMSTLSIHDESLGRNQRMMNDESISKYKNTANYATDERKYVQLPGKSFSNLEPPIAEIRPVVSMPNLKNENLYRQLTPEEAFGLNTNANLNLVSNPSLTFRTGSRLNDLQPKYQSMNDLQPKYQSMHDLQPNYQSMNDLQPNYQSMNDLQPNYQSMNDLQPKFESFTVQDRKLNQHTYHSYQRKERSIEHLLKPSIPDATMKITNKPSLEPPKAIDNVYSHLSQEEIAKLYVDKSLRPIAKPKVRRKVQVE
jgi:hypothetical protein